MMLSACRLRIEIMRAIHSIGEARPHSSPICTRCTSEYKHELSIVRWSHSQPTTLSEGLVGCCDVSFGPALSKSTNSYVGIRCRGHSPLSRYCRERLKNKARMTLLKQFYVCSESYLGIALHATHSERAVPSILSSYIGIGSSNTPQLSIK